MHIREILSLEAVLPPTRLKSKKKLLHILAKKAAQFFPLSAEEILDEIIEREKMGPTSLGNGMAIPRIKLIPCKKPLGIFIKLKEPIAFDHFDQEMVDLAFFLIAPKKHNTVQSEALTHLLRNLSDKEKIDKIRRAETKEEIYHILIEEF